MNLDSRDSQQANTRAGVQLPLPTVIQYVGSDDVPLTRQHIYFHFRARDTVRVVRGGILSFTLKPVQIQN